MLAHLLHFLVAHHYVVTGVLHHHRVWITTEDGEAWKSAYDAVQHALRLGR